MEAQPMGDLVDKTGAGSAAAEQMADELSILSSGELRLEEAFDGLVREVLVLHAIPPEKVKSIRPSIGKVAGRRNLGTKRNEREAVPEAGSGTQYTEVMTVSAPASARPLPLAGLHERLGAAFAPVDGFLVPARYGPPAEEYRALREGCGLVDRSWTGRLEVLGADRHRFLNAYVTCDVKSLAPGEGAYGFFTNPQGRILSDLVVLAHEDRLWLQLPAGREEAIAAHLRKYVLADRVEVRGLAELLPLALVGPQAAAALGSAELPPAGEWRHVRSAVHGTEVALQRTGRLGAEAFTLWVSAAVARPLAELLLGLPAVRPAGFEAMEILRAEAGIARFGQDFGPESFPQETGAGEAAVSYTKGCYLGQEVVARIHYRGGVQKALRGLAFAAGAAPRPGARLLFEGREVGTATTVVDSLVLGRPLGLAIVHRRAAAAGTRLDVEGGGQAEVRDL
jgi:folate-binding protein YgfZ